MAGDTKETGPGPDEIIAPETEPYSDPFPSLDAKLGALVEQGRGVITNGPAIFDLVATGAAGGLAGFAVHQWQRVRVSALVVSGSAAGTVTLTVGSFARVWNVDVGVTVIPYPVTIERATDVVLGGTAAGLTGYLIGTAE